MKNLVSAFLELFNKLPKFNKRLGIYNNGVDNNYPERVESAIENSVTASRCRNLMSSYISGKGFGDELNKVIINESKETTLLEFSQEISDSTSGHKGVYIQINYNGAYEIKNFDVLPFTDCRVGEKDDDRYNGKILVCEDWNNKKKAKKAKIVDVYNSNEKVIQEQIDKAGSIDKYNGQIFYFKFGKYTYPLSPIHPCLEDADSEKRASIYKNVSLRKGFFGKTLVVTKPLVDSDLKESEPNEYQEQVTARTNFRKTIQKFIGADNADGVLHLEMEFESDEIDKEILFKNIESNIDDKLFAHTENSVGDNIRMCFNNVPAPLIRSTDGKLFGSSGEAIREMKLFYQDQTEKERLIVEQIINKLMKNFTTPMKDLKIIPLIPKKEENGSNE